MSRISNTCKQERGVEPKLKRSKKRFSCGVTGKSVCLKGLILVLNLARLHILEIRDICYVLVIHIDFVYKIIWKTVGGRFSPRFLAENLLSDVPSG